VGERKGYANTDELQADDQLSPRPALDDAETGEIEISEDGSTVDDEGQIPRPATSE